MPWTDQQGPLERDEGLRDDLPVEAIGMMGGQIEKPEGVLCGGPAAPYSRHRRPDHKPMPRLLRGATSPGSPDTPDAAEGLDPLILRHEGGRRAPRVWGNHAIGRSPGNGDGRSAALTAMAGVSWSSSTRRSGVLQPLERRPIEADPTATDTDRHLEAADTGTPIRDAREV
jgi:hypothetical protein